MATSLKGTVRPFSNTRWDDPIKDELLTLSNKAVKVRLFPKIVPVRSHWFDIMSETKGKTGFGDLCLNYNSAKEEEIDGKCPYCAFGLKATEYLYAYGIVRAAQKKGVLQCVPIRLTSALAGKIMKRSEVVYPADSEDERAELEARGIDADNVPDALDPKFGFDLFLSKSVNNGKTEYDATPGDIAALTKDEVAAFKEYIAEGKDVALFAKPKSLAEAQQNLNRVEDKLILPKDFVKKPKALKSNKSYEEVGDDDGEQAAAPPKPKRPAAQTEEDDEPVVPVKRKQAVVEDDDEPVAPVKVKKAPVVAEDDDEPAAPKTVAKTKRYEIDDDDNEGVAPAKKPKRSYANADADDIPEDD